MVEVIIIQNRYSGGRRVYTAGATVMFAETKAAFAVENGWAKYVESKPTKPEVLTATNPVAEERQTTAVYKSSPPKRRGRPKKKK